MKKIKLFLFAFAITFISAANVNAAEVDSEAKLLECIANNDNTCILTKNIEMNNRIVIEKDNTIVLDLNKNTLDFKFDDDNYWSLYAKGNLTIQGNGTINIANLNGIAVTGNLIIKNGTYNQPVGDTIIGNYGGNLVVENGTFIGDYYGINGVSGTTVIKDGNFKTNPYKPWGMEDDYEYYWGIVYDEENGAELEVQKGTFNQILSWPNVLVDNAEVTYNLESQNVIYDLVTVNGNMTINLNGQKVMYDEASLYEGLDSLFYVSDNGKLTINDSENTGIITSRNLEQLKSVVKLVSKSKTAELIVNGGTLQGYDYAISGNKDSDNTKITINNGTLKSTSGNMGIYHPQNGIINIKNGVISGKTAIEIHAGQLNITGGNLESTNNKVLTVNSEEKIVNITGGTFTNDVKEYVATGYASVKNGDNYIVVKEYKINLNKPENGEVLLSSQTATEGEKVTFDIKPTEGYKLNTLEIIDTNENEIEFTDGTFVMPNSDVTIFVTFISKTSVELPELPTLDSEEEIDEIIVGVSEINDIEKTLLESLKTNKELADKLKDEEVVVGVEFSTVDEKTLDKKIVEKIQNASEKLTIINYFDISIVVKKENEKIDTIGELTKEIELMILLPDELKNVTEDLQRKYYVIREHEGTIEKIDAKLSEDGKYLTFKSDKFSTYALAYQDFAKVDSPQTSDNIVTSIVVGIMALFAFAGVTIVMKKIN